MKIAVIGNGIIGYISSLYLKRLGHEVDCISPSINTASHSNKIKTTKTDENIDPLVKSPKFSSEPFLTIKK